MADSMNGQIAKIVQCLAASFGADTLIQMVAPDDLGDLDVDELGGVEIGFFVQDVLQGLGFWRVKQPFEHGGGVEDDHCSPPLCQSGASITLGSQGVGGGFLQFDRLAALHSLTQFLRGRALGQHSQFADQIV